MGTVIYGAAAFNGVTLSDGLNLSATNSGATQIQNVSGSTVKWKADTGFGGDWAVECVNGAGNGNPAAARFPFDASNNVVSTAGDFYLTPLPGSGAAWETIVTVRTSSAVTVTIQIDPSGKMHVFCAGTELTTPTAPGGGAAPSLVAGTKYRLEVIVQGSPSVSTGTVSARIFAYGESTTTNYITGMTSSTATTGTTAYAACDWGVGAHATSFTMRYSNVRLITGSSSWIGPYTPSTPAFDIDVVVSPGTSVNAGTQVTLTVSRVAGTGTGTTLTYDADWGDGTSTPPQSSNVLTHTYNPTSTTAFNWTAGATLT